jgi:hypothetical protein
MEETTTSEQPSLYQHALKWGAIMGIINIIIGVLIYAIDYTMMADWKLGILIILIVIGVTIYSGINYRNQIGGFLPYGKAFQHGLIFMIIGGLIYSLYNLLLYTVIDPDLPSKLVDATMEKTEQMLENFGMSGEQLEKGLADARKRSEGQFSITGIFTGFAFSIIFYAVIALITSIFVRKNQPEEI